jgi:hypothetical protein
MSFEPSQEDIYQANPDIAVQDMKAGVAAENKDWDSLSDAELNKLADDYRVDVSQMQSQYTGIPGLGGKRIAQKTFAQLMRGDKKEAPVTTQRTTQRTTSEPPPAAFESKDYSILLQEKLAEMDLQREQVVVPDAVPPSTTTPAVPPSTTTPVVPPAPEAIPERFGVTPVTAGSESLFPPSVRQAAAESGTDIIERVKSYLNSLLEGKGEDQSKPEGTPPREPIAVRDVAPIEKGREKLREQLLQERDMTASLQDEMARGRDLKEQESTPDERPIAPRRVLDSSMKRVEATLEAPRQEQEGTRLSFADIVAKRTRNAPKTREAIAANEAQVGKAGSADRSSQTNIIKDYLNSMGYTKEMQTKFSKYFFDTFDQDVFFNQDVIIAALKMFNKEN